MEYTDIITVDSSIAPHIVILNSKGEVLKNVISYNNLTKEAEIEVFDWKDERRLTNGGEKVSKRLQVLLVDSRIAFKNKN